VPDEKIRLCVDYKVAVNSQLMDIIRYLGSKSYFKILKSQTTAYSIYPRPTSTEMDEESRQIKYYLKSFRPQHEDDSTRQQK